MEDEESKYEITFKIVLLGGYSGKTNIVERYCDNRYSPFPNEI